MGNAQLSISWNCVSTKAVQWISPGFGVESIVNHVVAALFVRTSIMTLGPQNHRIVVSTILAVLLVLVVLVFVPLNIFDIVFIFLLLACISAIYSIVAFERLSRRYV